MSCSRPLGRLLVGGSGIISIIFKNYLHISKKTLLLHPKRYKNSEMIRNYTRNGIESHVLI